MPYSHPLPSICLLTETYQPITGGGENQARLLAEELASRGLKVTIITRRVLRSSQKMEKHGTITVYRIPPSGLGQLKRWGMLLWALLALAKTHRRYEIIYVSGFKALGVSAVLVGKLLRKSCILKADSNGEMSGEFFAAGLKKLGLRPSSPVVRFILASRNKILRGADAYVAITSGIATELINHGVHPALIYSAPNSVDTKRFHPVSALHKQNLRRQLNLPRKEVLITYSGRLVSYKGLPLFVRVADQLQKNYPNTGFVFVGSGGTDIHNCEAELKAYVKSRGLEESVYFTGSVQNVHEYLQASDIFVSPTEKDAFPLALIEAMACGLPVITTPVGGILEIVSHKENGLLIEPRNFDQLYEAIAALINERPLAESLGQAAAQTAQERYSAGGVTDKYVELFRNLSPQREPFKSTGQSRQPTSQR